VDRDARLVTDGFGDIEWRARRDGRVWVYDVGEREVVWRGDIRTDQRIRVRPERDRIEIDDRTVFDQNLERRNAHGVYFLNNPGGDGGGLPSELRDAERVAFGRGDLSYVARNGGRVWVYDATDAAIVYRSDVRRDDRIVVSPERNTISLREAGARGSFRLNPRHDYAIYFERDDRVDDDRTETPAKPPGPDRPVFGGGGAGATVPKSSSIVREGRGEDLSFVADGAGTVYLYDVDGKTTLATHRVRKGQRFTVSPSSGKATVDGREVFTKSMSTKKSYRLYFNLDV
jgi:hypothetical protein